MHLTSSQARAHSNATLHQRLLRHCAVARAMCCNASKPHYLQLHNLAGQHRQALKMPDLRCHWCCATACQAPLLQLLEDGTFGSPAQQCARLIWQLDFMRAQCTMLLCDFCSTRCQASALPLGAPHTRDTDSKRCSPAWGPLPDAALRRCDLASWRCKCKGQHLIGC